MRLPLRACLTGLLCLAAWGTAWAQFDQYTTPGGPTDRPEDARKKLAKEVADARYHLGPVRIAPSVGLKDVSYIKTLLVTGRTAPADITATVGGGLRAYLPMGAKVTWTAYALPEYVWWQKESERRRFNERFGGGVHGFWNRLTLEATGGRDETQTFLTPELPTLTNTRQDHADLKTELRLSSRLSLFGHGSTFVQRSLADANRDPEAPVLELLDRREETARVGVHFRPAGGWVLGLGVERAEVRFLDRLPGQPDRSNTGTSPVLELLYDHSRLFLSADLAARSQRAAHGSDFVPYDQLTGQVAGAYRTEAGPEIFLYGNHNLVYSISPDYAYLDEERLGLALHSRLGHSSRGSVYVEGGTDGYAATRPTAARRKDDVTTFGGALEFDLGHTAILRFKGLHSRFTSNLPGGDRTFSSVGATLTLAGTS